MLASQLVDCSPLDVYTHLQIKSQITPKIRSLLCIYIEKLFTYMLDHKYDEGMYHVSMKKKNKLEMNTNDMNEPLLLCQLVDWSTLYNIHTCT